ncbi:NAD(P)H-hydrate dehydratase [Oceaniglobus indicus]|uniref:NAD(P)H-hydrate dehydratase n=1 Tax=Oceaniglobus indicus TaxID=2047749 RepID=UPI000C1A6449|nr:NAD(P)H-hydrate dehydratase [Oceaniglobus indicus]
MSMLLTAAQMRAVEKAAIDSGAVTGLELMERAGQGAIAAMLAEWPDLATGQRRAVVLCGPGNNGGDGFVVARLLRDLGWTVAVFLHGDLAKLPPDARTNARRWGEIWPLTTGEAARRAPAFDLKVDALFGTGLSRPLPAELISVMTHAAFQTTDEQKTLALDVPSGLSADTGQVVAPDSGPAGAGCIAADLTVTFHTMKPGHHLADGPAMCGRLAVVDIGLRDGPGSDGSDPRPAGCGLFDGERLKRGRSSPLSKAGGHKFDHGHALILSGGVGQGGAARMATRGALRIGAGLVTIACPPAALIENAAQLNAIMLRALKDADALAKALEDDRINALCAGPGLGITPRTADLVRQVLDARRNTVLDGDALTLVARDPDLFARLHDRCVLTPHGGEFARLFPDIAHSMSAPVTEQHVFSKVDATCAAAARAGCTVLFKGPDTVIATPQGDASIHSAQYDRAVPWLATAGAGDVLAGFVAGLLARGFAPMAAAETAAWLHVECARRFGPGLIAEDLPDRLPSVLRDLLMSEPPAGVF